MNQTRRFEKNASSSGVRKVLSRLCTCFDGQLRDFGTRWQGFVRRFKPLNHCSFCNHNRNSVWLTPWDRFMCIKLNPTDMVSSAWREDMENNPNLLYRVQRPVTGSTQFAFGSGDTTLQAAYLYKSYRFNGSECPAPPLLALSLEVRLDSRT